MARTPAALPMEDVHPAHLGACLPRLSEATLLRLQACPRLAEPLSGLLVRGGLEAWPEPGALLGPARLGLANRSLILRAATWMGAIWHAGSVRSVISSASVALLVEAIGADARAAALRHAGLAVAAAEPMAPRDLADAVARAADVCLGSWLAALPGGVRQRVLLKLPPRGPTPVEPDERAAAIIAAAVDEIMQEGTPDAAER